MSNIVTRFAPSPTGLLHAGSYRSALFAYIFAKKHGGKFILRIEDTDKARSKKEYEDNIIESLKWLNLDYDEFYRQSERTAIYEKHIRNLIDSGHAYISKETPQEEGGRTEVIRFKNPNKKVTFDDIVRGPIEFDTTELGDFIIAKGFDEPVFHLVNVVDDLEMGMTHVIRGEDHISNTPRQILIYEAIGAKVPRFAHIPLLLSKDRSKLSKRHGALPVSQYKDKGYIPEAIINYMALLGWHPEDDKEIMSLGEIIERFSLERVQKSGAIFDDEKLAWFNRQYIIKMGMAEFEERASAYTKEANLGDGIAKRIMPLLKEKISSFSDIRALLGDGGELSFIRGSKDYDASMLLWKKNPSMDAAREHLRFAREAFSKISDFNAESVKESIWPYAEKNGKGDVLWPLRVALTSQERSPDPVISACVIGKDESLKRIDSAISKLK